MELQPELRERLKQERLQQYAARIFQLQMDEAALRAVGDAERLELTQQQIADMTTAYEAVEGM